MQLLRCIGKHFIAHMIASSTLYSDVRAKWVLRNSYSDRILFRPACPIWSSLSCAEWLFYYYCHYYYYFIIIITVVVVFITIIIMPREEFLLLKYWLSLKFMGYNLIFLRCLYAWNLSLNDKSSPIISGIEIVYNYTKSHISSAYILLFKYITWMRILVLPWHF
jgi:hypothetical protein